VAELEVSLQQAVSRRSAMERCLEDLGFDPVTLEKIGDDEGKREKRRVSSEAFRARCDQVRESLRARKTALAERISEASSLTNQLIDLCQTN
jgi:hypothetical protein